MGRFLLSPTLLLKINYLQIGFCGSVFRCTDRVPVPFLYRFLLLLSTRLRIVPQWKVTGGLS